MAVFKIQKIVPVHALVTKKVKIQGKTAGVYVPGKWINKTVTVIKGEHTEKELNDKVFGDSIEKTVGRATKYQGRVYLPEELLGEYVTVVLTEPLPLKKKS
jgi:hypothetical protein